MPTDAMPVTALAVLFLLVGSVGVVGALFTALIGLAVYRERRDIRHAKAVAKAKREMKDRARRLKEEEASRLAKDDTEFNERHQVFLNGR